MNYDNYLLNQAYDHENDYNDQDVKYIYCVVDPSNKELLFSSDYKNEAYHNKDIYDFGRIEEQYFFNYKYFEKL